MLHAQQSTQSSQAQPSTVAPINPHQVNSVSTNSNASNPLFYPALSIYPPQPSQPTVTNINTAATTAPLIPSSLLSLFLPVNSAQSVWNPQTLLTAHRHVSFNSLLSADANTQNRLR